MPSVKVAVFPAAGLGTRFLPATKAQPKEMLPLVDRPLVQYVVEEAKAAGIERIVIVTGRGKNAIEDHFDTSFELEKLLEDRGKEDLLAIVREISDMIPLAYVRQKQALGLGHAILQAKDLVGNQPFAVMLGDDIVDSAEPCIGQMMRLFEERGNPVIAVQEVPREETRQYGIVAGVKESERVVRISGMVEKPPPERAPSNLAIIGRYILTPDIFPALEATGRDSTGEIQLTNGLRHLLRQRPVYVCEIDGVSHATGNKLGFLKALVYFALRRSDLGEPFRRYLQSLEPKIGV